jgi:hypothetical protein
MTQEPYQNIRKGLAPVSPAGAAPFALGITETEVLNSSAADAEPATVKNSRAVSVDSDGIVKFSYKRDDGTETTEVKYMAKGVWYHYRNVTKVFRYYTGTTAITTTVYGTDGVAVNGLKVHR